MDVLDILYKCIGFLWDDHNARKNWDKHKVSQSECEQVFFNLPLLAGDDKKHSIKELRYYLLGRTDERRYLFVVFTLRADRIRVISARDMNRKEKKEYLRNEEKDA